ncbi:MAG: aspartate-semialdehyde dehydrogenase [Chloroflexota bacterium]|nr:aspartate-semialdehyde dehydrogenase [Chloroflexota bacterium]
MAQKIDVAILGATGAVGQRFIQLLENHPWFRVAELIGSERSAGKTYGDAVRWNLDGEPPASVVDLPVKALDAQIDAQLVFSALPKEPAVARELELAAAGHIVCTNASAHRMADDVPLLLPEVNADHLALIEVQRERRGWKGALIANSNCTAMPIVMALAPLQQYGVSKIGVVSMQAVSGAGYPGVASLDILDNVIPYIGGDEENKVETETLKMLGRFDGAGVTMLDAAISASCNRVPVVDAHLVVVSVTLDAQPTHEQMIDAWDTWRAPELVRNLPTAPEHPTLYLRQQDRPQPRRDRAAGAGMTTTIGRLRPCSIFGYKFIALSHNTVRGAAGCAILNAELLTARGYFGDFQPARALQTV